LFISDGIVEYHFINLSLTDQTHWFLHFNLAMLFAGLNYHIPILGPDREIFLEARRKLDVSQMINNTIQKLIPSREELNTAAIHVIHDANTFSSTIPPRREASSLTPGVILGVQTNITAKKAIGTVANYLYVLGEENQKKKKRTSTDQGGSM
jgi:hypothetical protein